MTVEHIHTSVPRTAARAVQVARPVAVVRDVTSQRQVVHAPGPRRPPGGTGPLCLIVPELNEGDGTTLVRTLRRRESTRAVLLTRKAGRRELVVLLGGGIRGAVTAETPGAVRIVGRTPPPPPQPGPELTAREVGVLRLVADGRSNRQIGEHLELSALTVKSHLARISRKIGTGDRAEMVAFAIRNDLLS